MEQQLDGTYLRPRFLSKAVALSVASLGLGAAILLGSSGLSLFWRPQHTSIDVKISNPELTLKQDKPFVIKTADAPTIPELAARGNAASRETEHGEVIKQEVIVFSNVTHASGSIVTGWKFPDGSGGSPTAQFCYFTQPNPDQSSTRIDIAVNGKPLPREAIAKVPEVEKALDKCQWWRA
jgi:hypothetical protein